MLTTPPPALDLESRFDPDLDGDLRLPGTRVAVRQPTPSSGGWATPLPAPTTPPPPALDQTFAGRVIQPRRGPAPLGPNAVPGVAQRKGAMDTLFSADWFQEMPPAEAAEWRAVLEERGGRRAPPPVHLLVLAAVAGALSATISCASLVAGAAVWWWWSP